MSNLPPSSNQQFASPANRTAIPVSVSGQPLGLNRPPHLQPHQQSIAQGQPQQLPISIQQQINAVNQAAQNRARAPVQNQQQQPPRLQTSSIGQGQLVQQNGGIYMRPPPQLVSNNQGIRDLQPVGTVQFGGGVMNPQLIGQGIGPVLVSASGQPVRGQIVTSNPSLVRLPNGAILANPQQFINPNNHGGQQVYATLQTGPNQQQQLIMLNPGMCVPPGMMLVPHSAAQSVAQQSHQPPTSQQSIATLSPNMHPMLSQQLAQSQSSQLIAPSQLAPAPIQVAAPSQQKAPEVAKVEPFPHLTEQSSKDSPFSDCPTLKPAIAEDAEEDEPPPLLDRGDGIMKNSDSSKHVKEMPTIDDIDEKFVIEAMEFKNRVVVPRRTIIHEIDGMAFEESSSPFPNTQLKQKLRLGKGQYIKQPQEMKLVKKERNGGGKDDERDAHEERDDRRRRQRKIYGKLDDDSRKPMTRARRSDGKEREETTSGGQRARELSGRDSKGEERKPKKRRTNELEKLLHMDFGPKEGGKRLLTEMEFENKKRSSGDKADDETRKKGSPTDDEKKKDKRRNDHDDEDDFESTVKREEEEDEIDYCLWCQKQITNPSFIQFCSYECRKSGIAKRGPSEGLKRKDVKPPSLQTAVTPTTSRPQAIRSPTGGIPGSSSSVASNQSFDRSPTKNTPPCSAGSTADPTTPRETFEIDKPWREWTINEVAQWVFYVTSSEAASEAFRTQEIDGSVLGMIKIEELKEAFQLKFGPYKKLESALAALKAQL